MGNHKSNPMMRWQRSNVLNFRSLWITQYGCSQITRICTEIPQKGNDWLNMLNHQSILSWGDKDRIC